MKELGDIMDGRPNLGQEMPVLLYRLLEMSMNGVLEEKYGKEEADRLFREAGYRSGLVFSKVNLERNIGFDDFIKQLQQTLIANKIGILRLDDVNMDDGEIIMSIYEDLDCSGLPVTGEAICVYDEGFFAGVLEHYNGAKWIVQEIECWVSGDRVCRFQAKECSDK